MQISKPSYTVKKLSILKQNCHEMLNASFDPDDLLLFQRSLTLCNMSSGEKKHTSTLIEFNLVCNCQLFI